jgi:hypothetical protein
VTPISRRPLSITATVLQTSQVPLAAMDFLHNSSSWIVVSDGNVALTRILPYNERAIG